jgi:hypothetical protein
MIRIWEDFRWGMQGRPASQPKLLDATKATFGISRPHCYECTTFIIVWQDLALCTYRKYCVQIDILAD